MQIEDNQVIHIFSNSSAKSSLPSFDIHVLCVLGCLTSQNEKNLVKVIY